MLMLCMCIVISLPFVQEDCHPIHVHVPVTEHLHFFFSGGVSVSIPGGSTYALGAGSVSGK